MATTAQLATGGGGVALATLAGEMYRWYLAAEASAAETLAVAFDKAQEAGAMQTALTTCQETIMELARTCGP